jgi:hypothetical protein
MIVTADTEHVREMGLAKEVGEWLHQSYPGHLWAVSVRGGVIVVKALNISSIYGFVLKQNDVMHDAGYRKKEVMRAGGELLERAGLKRGEYGFEKVKKLDGFDKYQPAR